MSRAPLRTPHQANVQEPRFREQYQRYSPHQQEIINSFRAEEYVKDQMDVQPGHIWDCLNFAAGQKFTDKLTMFSYPQGQADPRFGDEAREKTAADTSMHAPNHLMNPEAFAIRRVIFSFNKTASEKDIYAIAEGFVWRLILGRKPYLGCPIISLQTVEFTAAPIRICDFCRSVYANETACPGCGARQFSLSTMGGEAGRAFAMDLGKATLVIEQGIWFGIAFEGPPHQLSAPLKMWCHFEGLHARGIQ